MNAMALALERVHVGSFRVPAGFRQMTAVFNSSNKGKTNPGT